MFIFVRTDYNAYKQIPVSTLVNPLSGVPEAMKLVLYQPKTKTTTIGSITVYSPKATGTFFTADGKDIPTSKWTDEMERFFEQQKSLYPVPHKGWKLSLLAKLAILAALAFVLACIFFLGKALLIDKPKKDTIKAAIAQPILTGEQYNISSYNPATQKTGYFWVRVAQADAASKTYRLCLTGETSGEGFTVPDHLIEMTDADQCFNSQLIKRGNPHVDDDELQFRIGHSTEWLYVKTYAFDKVEQFKRKPEE